MPDKHLFEYAVIRVVPKVEREEFLNVGIILYCKQRRYLRCLYTLDQEKLKAICPTLECEEVAKHLTSFDAICAGSKTAGGIASLDLPSRFRWLTATRSTVVQTSKTHPGFCKDLDETLQRLFQQLVL